MLLVVLLETLLLLLMWPSLGEYGLTGLAVQAVLVLALLFRRAAPMSVAMAMLLGTIALVVVQQLDPGVLDALDSQGSLVLVAVPVATYSVVVYGSDRRQSWLITGILALVAARPLTPSVDGVLGAVVMVVLPALLGNYIAGLTERVERAEREQHELAEQARAEERVRLAAEMHDVVTHRVSLMVLQAGALGLTAPDEATRASAETLRSAGCQALEELRDLVGVLRSAPGDVVEETSVSRAGGEPPVPDLTDLLAESRSVGMPVEFDLRGDPGHASPVVSRTAYRVVQEALTNVRKHAPGARTAVTVVYGADRVRLAVRNTAPEVRVDGRLTGSGSGTGLLGLRQRIELVSGTLRAGPTEDGGFELSVVLPAYVPTPDGPGPGRPRLAGRSERVSSR